MKFTYYFQNAYFYLNMLTYFHEVHPFHAESHHDGKLD